MSISFTCNCGKKFRVPDEMAGRKGKCPQCSTTFRIPMKDGAAAKTVPTKPVAKKRASAATPSKPVADDSSLFDFGAPDIASSEYIAATTDGSLEHRRRRKSGRGKFVVFTFFLLLLGGGAGAAYWKGYDLAYLEQYFRPETGLAADLKYLPNNCQVLISLNVENLLASASYARARAEASKVGFDLEKKFQETIAILALADVRRVTIGASAAAGIPPMTAVVRTRKPLTADDIKAALAKNVSADFKEVVVGKHVVYEAKDGAFCLVNDKTIVMGKADEVRKVVERDQKAELSAALQAAVKKVDFTKAAVGLVVEARALREGAQLAASLTPLPVDAKMLDSFEAFTLEIDVSETIDLQVTLLCKDEATAELFKRNAEGGFTLLERNSDVPKAAQSFFKAAKATADGAGVTLSFATNVDTIIGLTKDAGPVVGKFLPGGMAKPEEIKAEPPKPQEKPRPDGKSN